MEVQYRFSEADVKKLLAENFVILHDTREQQNQHILDFLDKNKIKHKRKALYEGDYTAMITKREDMGILRDLYFNVAVERKNSIDELAGNLSEETDSRDDIRLEREFKRAKQKGMKMWLIIEDKNGLEKIIKGDYRSQYGPKAFEGKLNSLRVNYLNGLEFVDRFYSGRVIAKILYYAVMESLKDHTQEIIPSELLHCD